MLLLFQVIIKKSYRHTLEEEVKPYLRSLLTLTFGIDKNYSNYVS